MIISNQTLEILSELNDRNAFGMLQIQKTLQGYKTQVEYNPLLTLHNGFCLRGDRVKLKYTEETLRVVECHDLDAFITELSGHEFECVSSEGWRNDSSSYRVYATGDATDYAKKAWEQQKKGEGQDYSLSNILDCLVDEKLLEPGTYLIRVSW